MGETNVAAMSRQFAEKLREAHAYLRGEMERLGLHEHEGWRISEVIRECVGGSELVLRPIHTSLDAPAGLECIVWFVEAPAHVGAECLPPLPGSEVRWRRSGTS